MEKTELNTLVEAQYNFFVAGKTLSVQFRKSALVALKDALKSNEKAIMDALWADLRKPTFETYAHEIGQVLKEISLHLKKLKRWTKPKQKRMPVALLPSWGKIYPEPYGNVLIVSPWNYPVLLLFSPLIGAISAGNTAVLKPSPYLKEFSKVVDQLIGSVFPREYIAVVHGGRETNQLLLKSKWDYIFFTGSPSLGKIVMKAAAENLTPLTLELGGKNPCIVDKDANLRLAAKRIVWGKFINAGQTCIAPDYLFVHEDIKEELLVLMQHYLEQEYSKDPVDSPDFCRIVNDSAFERLIGYLKDGDLFYGGETERSDRYISPTIIDNVEPDFPVMQEEIFGPVLPVMTFGKLDKALEYVNSCDKPLAFYYFSNNMKKAHSVIRQTSSGGGCINDTIIQIASNNLPFGGVGNSGMGKYHGKASFDTFTNYRSMAFSSRWIDIPLKYPPYKNKLGLIRKILSL